MIFVKIHTTGGAFNGVKDFATARVLHQVAQAFDEERRPVRIMQNGAVLAHVTYTGRDKDGDHPN